MLFSFDCNGRERIFVDYLNSGWIRVLLDGRQRILVDYLDSQGTRVIFILMLWPLKDTC